MKKSPSSSNNKPAPNASAPSEQQLKEEEEFQLALALSLSETPAKFSFPDISQFEEQSTNSSSTTGVKKIDDDHENPDFVQQKIAINSYLNTVESTNVQNDQVSNPVSTSIPAQPIQQQLDSNNVKSNQELELRQLIEEARSTAEVIVNRVHSNRSRNRSNDHDSALQTLFLKLTGMRDKLLEYSKNYEQERVLYERLQDKLSEISDARAALDSLREEHQEKKRKDAEEAERQRQSQLALKLSMMREKKSQMMQHHRELALQRIQAQEMINQGPSSVANNTNTVNTATVQSYPQQTNLNQVALPDYYSVVTNHQPYLTQQVNSNQNHETLHGYQIPNATSQPTYTAHNHQTGPSYSMAPANSQQQPQQQAIGIGPVAGFPLATSTSRTLPRDSVTMNDVPVTGYSMPAASFPSFPTQQTSSSLVNNNSNPLQWNQQQSLQQSTQVSQSVLPKPDDEAPLISFDD